MAATSCLVLAFSFSVCVLTSLTHHKCAVCYSAFSACPPYTPLSHTRTTTTTTTQAYIQGAEAAAKLAANRQQDVRYSPPSQQQQQQHQPSPTNPPATTLTGSIVMTSAYSCPDLAEPPSAPPVRMAPIAPVPPPVATPATFSPPRTMSLPDMTQYAAQQEDDKRQKRLARNRASARLRRLRKKNLVDAYEQEVGSLQSTLAALQAHRWGTADHAGALADALSMDRGQQVLDEAADRKREAASLLAQQLQWVAMLEDVLLEDRVLHELATTETMENPELAQLAATLQLSPSQRESIVESQRGWQEEWEALQTVKASLVALQENEWLWNESVGSVAEQFMVRVCGLCCCGVVADGWESSVPVSYATACLFLFFFFSHTPSVCISLSLFVIPEHSPQEPSL
jgi:hypothetical protein